MIDLSHLRVFGSKAYSLVHTYRGKWERKSKPYIMVGYCDKTKGYRLADLKKPGFVYIRYHVNFIEGMRNPANRESVPELFNFSKA